MTSRRADARWLLTLLCVGYLACGDPCGDDPNCGAGISVKSHFKGLDTCEAVPIKSFMDAVWEAWCKPKPDCKERLRPGDRFADPDVCVHWVRQHVLAPHGIEKLVAGAQVGTIVYNKKRACTCLAAVANGCVEADFLHSDGACNGIFGGTQNNGSACSFHGECAGGSCRPSLAPLSPSCPGSCLSASDEGDDCGPSQACAPGLLCRFSKCVPATFSSKGESCGGLGCNDGLYCDWFDGGVCKTALAAGTKCSLDDASCPKGHYCAPEPSPADSGRVCAPLHGAGQVCQMDAGTQQTCVAGYVCVGTCLAFVALGGPCSHSAQCHEDAACVNGRCSALPAVGEACSVAAALQDELCKQPAICDPATSECVALPGEGKPCIDGECAPGFGCVKGTCTTGPQHGQPCASAGKLCADNHICIAGTCEKEVCK